MRELRQIPAELAPAHTAATFISLNIKEMVFLRLENGPGRAGRFRIGHQQQEHQIDPRRRSLSPKGDYAS